MGKQKDSLHFLLKPQFGVKMKQGDFFPKIERTVCLINLL